MQTKHSPNSDSSPSHHSLLPKVTVAAATLSALAYFSFSRSEKGSSPVTSDTPLVEETKIVKQLSPNAPSEASQPDTPPIQQNPLSLITNETQREAFPQEETQLTAEPSLPLLGPSLWIKVLSHTGEAVAGARIIPFESQAAYEKYERLRVTHGLQWRGHENTGDLNLGVAHAPSITDSEGRALVTQDKTGKYVIGVDAPGAPLLGRELDFPQATTADKIPEKILQLAYKLEISGVVQDAETGEPLQGVQVYAQLLGAEGSEQSSTALSKLEKGLSDDFGVYTIEGLPSELPVGYDLLLFATSPTHSPGVVRYSFADNAAPPALRLSQDSVEVSLYNKLTREAISSANIKFNPNYLSSSPSFRRTLVKEYTQALESDEFGRLTINRVGGPIATATLTVEGFQTVTLEAPFPPNLELALEPTVNRAQIILQDEGGTALDPQDYFVMFTQYSLSHSPKATILSVDQTTGNLYANPDSSDGYFVVLQFIEKSSSSKVAEQGFFLAEREAITEDTLSELKKTYPDMLDTSPYGEWPTWAEQVTVTIR